jgi:hypothetical protein
MGTVRRRLACKGLVVEVPNEYTASALGNGYAGKTPAVPVRD